MSRRFSFDLFRLNVEDANDLVTQSQLRRIRTDEEIAAVLKLATDPAQDQFQKTRSTVFKRSVREYRNLLLLRGGRELWRQPGVLGLQAILRWVRSKICPVLSCDRASFVSVLLSLAATQPS